jgi:catalase
MNDVAREHTVYNITKAITGVPRDIQERAIKNFYKADPEYGNSIAKNLGFSALKPRL